MIDFSRRHFPLLVFAALVVAVAVTYGQTLDIPWYLDDDAVIGENPVVRQLDRAWAGFFAQRGPVILSFALNYHFGGLAPAGYHLVNLALHLACAWLVFLLLRRLPGLSPGLAAAGALLFALHPLQTQAVNYTVQRMALGGTAASLTALWLAECAWTRRAAGTPFAAPGHLLLYLAALVTAGLAVLCKESSAVFPLLLALYLLATGATGGRRLAGYCAPFALVPLLVGGRLLLAPLAAGHPLSDIAGTNLLANMQQVTPLSYLVTELPVYFIYLRLLLLPYGQTLDHNLPIAQGFPPASIAALIVLLLAGLALWRGRRQLPLVAFGGAWFVLALLVESSVIPLDPLFEHRLHFALFGFIVALLGLLQRLPGRRSATVVLALALIISGVLSWQRNQLWRDPVAFLEDNLAKAPQSERVMANLGLAYFERGRNSEAEALLRRALERNPLLHDAYLSLMKLYERQERFADGLALGQRASERFPGSARIAGNIGSFYSRLGDSERALFHLYRAVSLEAGYYQGYANLGRILYVRGELAEAGRNFERALASYAADPEVYNDYALVLWKEGRLAEGLAQLEQARALAPDNRNTLHRLVLLAHDSHDLPRARAALARLAQINPELAAELARTLSLR